MVLSLLWASYQYYKYFVPIVLFFALKGLNMSSEDATYYGNLVIKLMLFQVVFSILKLIIIGFRENITGTYQILEAVLVFLCYIGNYSLLGYESLKNKRKRLVVYFIFF
jgi:hypothetical protein